MPVVFRAQGYAFFFYSNEGRPREPVHVHVRKGAAVAKFWLYPEVCLAESYGLNSQEQGTLADRSRTAAGDRGGMAWVL